MEKAQKKARAAPVVDALSLLQNRAAQAIKWPTPRQFNMPRRFARLSRVVLKAELSLTAITSQAIKGFLT